MLGVKKTGAIINIEKTIVILDLSFALILHWNLSSFKVNSYRPKNFQGGIVLLNYHCEFIISWLWRAHESVGEWLMIKKQKISYFKQFWLNRWLGVSKALGVFKTNDIYVKITNFHVDEILVNFEMFKKTVSPWILF